MNQERLDSDAPAPVNSHAFLSQLSFGASVTQALYVAAKLGIADLLAEGPQSVGKLASITRTHQKSLYRLLRSLSGIGVFQETDPAVFAIGPQGDALRSDSPSSFRNAAIFMGEEWVWRVWSSLLYSVQTGKPGWGCVHSVDAWEYLAANPNQAEIFNRAMTDMSVAAAPVVVEA
jgi:hypothetical protein